MKMTDTYEWLFFENGHVKVGITKKASKEIGEIVHIHFPKVGQKVEKGKEILVLESTKSAIDTYAPISGEIVEVNTKLLENLNHLNDDPEGKGWLFSIKPHNINQYLSLDDYKG
jgi:glycine cleavage system H protein